MKTGKDGISDIISVFNMYEQKMYHIAYAILHDSYQAEDAVMDAFVRLLERQYSIEDPAANATKRLIIQVTRSAAIDLYRKNKRETERQTLVDDPSALRSSGQENAFTFEAGDLESMLQHLPQIYRDVLYCSYVRELSTEEIADELGISQSAVRKRKERGLRMLRERMDKSKGSCEVV